MMAFKLRSENRPKLKAGSVPVVRSNCEASGVQIAFLGGEIVYLSVGREMSAIFLGLCIMVPESDFSQRLGEQRD